MVIARLLGLIAAMALGHPVREAIARYIFSKALPRAAPCLPRGKA